MSMWAGQHNDGSSYDARVLWHFSHMYCRRTICVPASSRELFSRKLFLIDLLAIKTCSVIFWKKYLTSSFCLSVRRNEIINAFAKSSKLNLKKSLKSSLWKVSKIEFWDVFIVLKSIENAWVITDHHLYQNYIFRPN